MPCAELSSVPRGVLHVVVTTLEEGIFTFPEIANLAVQQSAGPLLSAGEHELACSDACTNQIAPQLMPAPVTCMQATMLLWTC